MILVLDARGMTRSVAALALGYRAFDPALRFAGVILNRVGGSRHEAKLVAALSQHTDLPVLGCIPEDKTLSIVERHLGLMPSNEQGDALRTVELIADAVEAGVDLGRLCAGARVERAGSEAGSECEGRPQRAKPAVPGSTPVAAGRAGDAASGSPADTVDAARLRIGIARDEAFGFYYADDLEALEAAGAELVPFDTLRDRRLPAVDALFIGGGFPEEMAAALQANRALRAQLRDEIEAGLPVYAECGGLMYLSRSIERRGERFEMVGAIPADTVMHARAVGRGYVHLERTGDFPWESCAGSRVRAHEFHHSGLRDADPGLRYAYRVLRGHGIDGERDGIVHRNVLASYAHLRSVAGNDWPARFVAFAARIAAQRAAGEAGAHPLSPNDPPEETLHGRRDPSRR